MRYSEWFAHWWADQQARWSRKRKALYDNPELYRWVSFDDARELVARLSKDAKLGFTPFVRQNMTRPPGTGLTIDHFQKPIIEFGYGNVMVWVVCHELGHAAVFRKLKGVPGVAVHGVEWRAWRDWFMELAVEPTAEA